MLISLFNFQSVTFTCRFKQHRHNRIDPLGETGITGSFGSPLPQPITDFTPGRHLCYVTYIHIWLG